MQHYSWLSDVWNTDKLLKCWTPFICVSPQIHVANKAAADDLKKNVAKAEIAIILSFPEIFQIDVYIMILRYHSFVSFVCLYITISLGYMLLVQSNLW